jgi:hypothetical protein
VKEERKRRGEAVTAVKHFYIDTHKSIGIGPRTLAFVRGLKRDLRKLESGG